MESYTDRRASWLESFYDLIVAIVVLQLSINLSHDVSVNGFFKFVALFIPVFWAWIGVTFYATRFGTDDVIHRFLMLLQIGAFAFMAVNIPDGLGSNSGWFAFSYAASRAILIVEYLRAGRHVPAARKLTDSLFHWIFDFDSNMVCICIRTSTTKIHSMDYWLSR